MTLTPNALHGRLDDRGLLDDAHGSGTYALEVETPDTVEGVARAFLKVADGTPTDHVCDRLTAQRVAYVGASKDVYSRLQDHAEAEVRQATFLEAFDAVDVVGVWPTDTPFQAEFNRAAALSREGWVAYTDGEVL